MTVIVHTTCGVVRGLAKDGTCQWRGIPYAAPPVGARRFRPPEPPEPWTGERDATRFGAAAIQSRDPGTTMLSGVPEKMATSEDCLTLNVISPAADGARRPVIVWIHGGAFIMGTAASPLYDGTPFAKHHDLVVVSINYRLGLLGFLLVDGGAGNVALLDQVAALRWVQANIAAFGGDPDAVTIMGESAGAVSVSMLLAMPAARGLYHRAIAQSGAPGIRQPTRDDALAVSREVLAELALDADIPAILAMQERLANKRGLAAFTPYVDGDTIPHAPRTLIGDGSAAGVPLLVGANRDEWALFALFLGDRATAPLKVIVKDWLGARFDAVVALYRADWTRLIGDVVFGVPVTMLADTQVTHAPVFVYRFDHRSSAFGGALGAAHALELPFVWDQLDLPVSQLLLGSVDDASRALATRMHDAWAAFVRTGDPGWPAYDLARRSTMIFDRTSRVELDPDAVTRAAWDAT